ncbi:MAG: hypothetical protein JWM21_2759 [Acidobacteria bacterium]|nr:hypothetical protein [Acidobacteriota bacterium]
MDNEFDQDNAAHSAGTRKGEELGGNEAGRHSGPGHPDDQSPGRTARDATGVNPDNAEPIDPAMPHMPPN